MKVTVEYFGQIREAARTASESIEAPPSQSLFELLVGIARRRGWPVAEDASAAGKNPLASNLIFHNQEAVHGDFARPLADGDVVAILSPIAGG